MRMNMYRFAVPALLLGALLASGVPKEASAGVDVGVSVNIGPPPIVVAEPPELVLVPGSQVYFVPGVNFEVFYFNGWWWSPRGERWYRSRLYNGPWNIVERRFIPGPLFRVPRDYRTLYGRERHIPYRDWRDRHLRREHREIMERHERKHERHEMREHREERREHGERGHGHDR
jgi:hypothetical protein